MEKSYKDIKQKIKSGFLCKSRKLLFFAPKYTLYHKSSIVKNVICPEKMILVVFYRYFYTYNFIKENNTSTKFIKVVLSKS